jgi:hypothetical protein
MTIKELFEREQLTLEMVDEKQGQSSYWDSACKFLNEKWDEDLDSLTAKQSNWAQKICEDLAEQRIEGRL